MIADLMDKIGRNVPLTSIELNELRNEFRSMDEVKNLVKGWVQAGTSNPIFVPPVKVVYTKRLEAATASITVPIPGEFRVMKIRGSGSIDQANGGNVWAQFNGDTGNNYSWQFVKVDNATISGTQDTSDPYAVLGVFGTTGAGSGVNGTFVSEIVGYASPVWKKNVISLIYTAEFNDLYVVGSTWANTNAINSVEIFGTDNTLTKGTANFIAGCEFSVEMTV